MNNVLNNKNIEILVYKSFFKKLIGLSFKKEPLTYGVLFTNTNGIHTFFMRQNIDVVLFDKSFNVLYKFSNVSKGKIIMPKRKVKHTLELPVGGAKYF